MRYGSLFSGIGGIDLGLDRAGWECVFQVEIDPFCQKILKKRWPNAAKYTDVTKICGRELADRHGRIDALCGGFPCQGWVMASSRKWPNGLGDGLTEWFRAMKPQPLRVPPLASHIARVYRPARERVA